MGSCVRELIWDHALDFICLQEIKKPKITAAILRRFDPSGAFFWTWLSSKGKSGGIMMGVRSVSFDVQNSKLGKYVAQMCLWDKQLKIRWNLLFVYGAAHDEDKEEFLVELADFLTVQDAPYIVGGISTW